MWVLIEPNPARFALQSVKAIEFAAGRQAICTQAGELCRGQRAALRAFASLQTFGFVALEQARIRNAAG